MALLGQVRESCPSVAPLGHVELTKMQKRLERKNKNENENQNENKNENLFLFSFSFLFSFDWDILSYNIGNYLIKVKVKGIW